MAAYTGEWESFLHDVLYALSITVYFYFCTVLIFVTYLFGIGWNDSRNRGEYAVVTGDGEFLDSEAVETAVSTMEQLAVSIPWEKGDLLLLDNRTVMHARRPFSGSRRILASLVRHAER